MAQRTTKPIETYLIEYVVWLFRHHPGPQWLLGQCLRNNVDRWRATYGDGPADKAESEATQQWKAKYPKKGKTK